MTYNPANETVTLTPSSSLAYSTTYTATLSGAKDLYGNTMTSVSWSFTTTAAPVTTAPTVTVQSPAANATGVAIARPVTATFSAAVQPSTISFTLKNGSTTVSASVSYNPVSQTVTVTPTASLAYATTYTATLSGAKDLYGNTMATVSWSFTTTTAPVTTAPTVTAQSPASGATGVAITSSVTATFSAEVQPSTISFVLMQGSTTIGALVSYDPTTNIVTLDPNANLAYGSTYTATLSGAKDLYGNTMATLSWSFTTVAAPSTTPPTVTAQSPASGATGVPVAGNVTATFSEAVQASTISFVLMNGSTSIPATVSYDATTNTVTLDPNANLAPSTTYTVTLNGAQDPNGNTMTLVSWSFTTEAANTTAPTLTSQSPAANATGVPVAGNVTATFSEAVQPSTISFVLKNGSATVSALVTYDPASGTVTLDPTANLAPSTTYAATLSGAQDLYGNSMATVSWSFTTEAAFDSAAPTVTSVGPASGATGVPVTSAVTAAFNEDVQGATISFVLVNGSTSLPATVSYDPTTDIVTLQPSSSMAYGTTYTATLSGVQDVAGDIMTSPVSWSFTTVVAPA